MLWVDGVERADTAITMDYDILGRRTRILDPDAGERSFAYNALDQVHRETDAKGQVTRSAYDKLGRLRVRIDDATAPNPGERTHQWTWDIATHGIGQLASLTGFDTDGNAYSEYYYYEPVLGQLTRTDIHHQGRTYYLQTGYDGFGRPAVIMRQSSEIWPSDHYRFYLRKVYDNRGYLIREHKEGDPNTVYWQLDSLNARGQTTQETYGNGVVTTRSYDAATGRPHSLQVSHGSTPIAHQTWAWDSAGNLLEREDLVNNLTQTFCYDSLHRLTAALLGDCTTLSQAQFAYDALGNLTRRLTHLWGTPIDLHYSYGPSLTSPNAGPHALTQAEVPGQMQANVNYDANGNLINDTWIPRDITWNSYNLPATVSNQNILEGELALSYTPDRERLSRNDYDEIHTTYARPGYYEREQTGSLVRYRYYLSDYAILERSNDGGSLGESIHYRHADPQNSLIATSGSTPGTDTQHFAYEAWGIPLYDDWSGWHRDWNDPLPITQRGYTGQEHLQQSGLLHLNGRVYDPYMARFLSPDPELQDPADTQSYNRYSYVLNNPLKYTDPTGFWSDGIHITAPRLGMDDYLRMGEFRDTGWPNNLASSPLYNFQQQPELQGRAGAWQVLGEPDPAANTISAAAGVGEGGKIAAEFVEPTAADAAGIGVFSRFFKALRLGARAAGDTARATTVGAKIEGQLVGRGWSRSSVDDAISNPTRTVQTRDTRHLPGGGRNNDPATAYYSRDGGYVVRNDKTGDIVQVSNRNNPNWSAPWD